MCDGRGNKVVEACPSGCTRMGEGMDDVCNGTGAPSCTSAEFDAQDMNGASFWTCEGSTRYLCDGNHDKITEVCAGACLSNGEGQDDICSTCKGCI